MALQSWAGKHGGATGPGPYAGSLPHLCHIQGGGGGGEGGAGGQQGGGVPGHIWLKMTASSR